MAVIQTKNTRESNESVQVLESLSVQLKTKIQDQNNNLAAPASSVKEIIQNLSVRSEDLARVAQEYFDGQPQCGQPVSQTKQQIKIHKI